MLIPPPLPFAFALVTPLLFKRACQGDAKSLAALPKPPPSAATATGARKEVHPSSDLYGRVCWGQNPPTTVVEQAIIRPPKRVGQMVTPGLQNARFLENAVRIIPRGQAEAGRPNAVVPRMSDTPRAEALTPLELVAPSPRLTAV